MKNTAKREICDLKENVLAKIEKRMLRWLVDEHTDL